MIGRRKLFAFSAAVAVSPSAAISANAETRPVVEMVALNPEVVAPTSIRHQDNMNVIAFRDILMEGLKEFDGEYEPMQYYDSWQQ